MYIGAATVEGSMEVSEKLKRKLPYASGTSLLNIYSKEMKSLPWRAIYTLYSFNIIIHNIQEMKTT